MLLHWRGRVRHRCREAAAHEDRQIGEIVADVRALFRCESELPAQLFPRFELVRGTEATLFLSSVELRIPISELYEGIAIPAATADS